MHLTFSSLQKILIAGTLDVSESLIPCHYAVPHIPRGLGDRDTCKLKRKKMQIPDGHLI